MAAVMEKKRGTGGKFKKNSGRVKDLSGEEIDFLKKNTKYDEKEILEWHWWASFSICLHLKYLGCITLNWTAPVYMICIQCTAQEGHNWWWSILNETAFEILMSENLPRRLHFFCLETCHVVYKLTPSVYLLVSVRLWNFCVIHSKAVEGLGTL